MGKKGGHSDSSASGDFVGKFGSSSPQPKYEPSYASPPSSYPPPPPPSHSPPPPSYTPPHPSYNPPPSYNTPPSAYVSPSGAYTSGSVPSPHGLSPEDPLYHSHQFVDSQGRVQKYETVQDRLLNVLGGAFARIWRSSETVVRADLVRPYNPKQAKLNGEEESHEAQQRGKRRKRRLQGAGWEACDGYLGGMIQGLDRGIYGNGAQLKLMQIWRFRDEYTGHPKLPGGLNFGLGCNFDIDSGRLQLKTRLSSTHVVLRLFPKPDIELRGRWPLGNTRIGVDVRYRVPVKAPEQYYDPGQLGYLGIRFFNTQGAGFSLSPDGGVEFDDQVVKLGNHTKFRVAAKLALPRYFPWDEDEEPLSIEFRRLGIKTVLT